MSKKRIVGKGAVLGALVAVAGGLTAAPAHADYGYWQSCLQQVGSYHYNGWDIPNVTLGQGSSGVCVKEVQSDLVQLSYVAGSQQATFVDGSYGPNTANAVWRYQHDHPETNGADGVVGKYTWHSLIAHTEFE